VAASVPPLAAVASLRLHVVGSGGTSVFFLGTGWFMTPTTVVTAAHVTDITKAWSSVVAPVSWHIEILPGLAAGQKPFGTFWASAVTRHPAWTGVHTTNHDIAVLKTSAASSGLPFPQESCLRPAADVISAASMPAVTVAGYPHIVNSGGTPVTASGPVRVVEGGLCFYDIDTEDGESGAPVLTPIGGHSTPVAAIHSGGQGNGATSLSNGLNAGLRMRQDLVQWLNAQ
jgi:glutamyl endopeptidase